MTDHRHTIRDIDLMAYADGLLDSDPQRKAEVESYFREHPEEAARVRDYAAQNEVIRWLYKPVLTEPIPERLWGAFESRRGWTLGPVARAAIAASLILAAGFTGWIIGQRGRVDHWPMQAFVKQTMMAYARPAFVASSGADSALDQAKDSTVQPLNWLFQQVAVPLHPPDLTAEGFTLVEQRLVAGHGPQVAQVTYAASGGRRLSLFLRTRWQDEIPQFHFVEDDGVTMVYWLEGAMVYALVGQIDRQEMVHVVQTLRASMRQQAGDDQAQIDTTAVPEMQPIAPVVTPLHDTLLRPHVAPTQPVQSKYP